MKRTKQRTAKVVIFWDYDTQWGGDRSRSGNGPQQWGILDFENTEKLLEIHARFQVPACFAVVGAAALPGNRPYHDPKQIRAIDSAGHEIASHSFHHDWLPGLSRTALRDTLIRSKRALEDCIGREVLTFVPPYNQPYHYLRKGSISLSEMRQAGRDHVSLPLLCDELYDTGYRFCRVSYRPWHVRCAEFSVKRRLDCPVDLENIAGMTCVRLNTSGGFGADAIRMLHRSVARSRLTVVYGHPHSALSDTAQGVSRLIPFLETVSMMTAREFLQPALPRDLLQTPGLQSLNHPSIG